MPIHHLDAVPVRVLEPNPPAGHGASMDSIPEEQAERCDPPKIVG